MYSAENAGLIKFDFLGLKTLTVIDKTQKLIKKIDTEFKVEEINYDVNSILPELKKLMELEKERKVTDSGITHINLEAQASVFDGLLEKYEFFQNDADINGLRLKAIANQFLRNAKKHGMTELVKEKKADKRWKFFW